MARSMSALAKPMLSIFSIAAFRWAPRANADGSLKFPPSRVDVVDPAGTGEGVAGTFAVDVLDVATGAGGTAGVF